MKKSKGGIILPEPVKPELKRTGARKRRIRRIREMQENCGCGRPLRTRRGETRCPVHGTMWSNKYWTMGHWPKGALL